MAVFVQAPPTVAVTQAWTGDSNVAAATARVMANFCLR
jgi:hypothetical protein